MLAEQLPNSMLCKQRFYICYEVLCCVQRIAEHDYLKAEEVEGADGFLRASRQEHNTLRRRGRQLTALHVLKVLMLPAEDCRA